MAVIGFSGVDTGRMYLVGRAYESAGRVYIANPDGSFSRPNQDGSWGRSVGSSQSPDALFVHSSLASGNGPSSGVVVGASASEAVRNSVGGRPAEGRPHVAEVPTVGPGVGQVVASGGKYIGNGPGAGDFIFATKGTQPLEVKSQPLKRVGNGTPAEGFGAISDYGFANTTTGYVVVPSEQMKERIEDDIFAEVTWHLRNRVLPDIMLAPQPTPDFLPIGKDPGEFSYQFWTSSWVQNPPSRGTRPADSKYVTGGGF